MTIRGDHAAAIDAAYRAGALHDAVMRDVDGEIHVSWPDGRGQCVCSPELVEEWAGEINRLRRELAEAKSETT